MKDEAEVEEKPFTGEKIIQLKAGDAAVVFRGSIVEVHGEDLHDGAKINPISPIGRAYMVGILFAPYMGQMRQMLRAFVGMILEKAREEMGKK